MVNDLDESDFDEWLKHPITLKLFETYKENQEFLKSSILGLNPIFEENLDRKIAFYHGSLEITNKLLDLHFNQLFLIEEEKSDEETPYSW